MANLFQKDFSTAQVGINIPRTKLPLPSQLKTSFNVGDLVPIYFSEVLPGSTWQLDTAYVARMSTPIKPTMDNLYMDISYFFVPNRLVWEHWEEFQGANKTGYWTQPVEYEIPQIRLTDPPVQTGIWGFQHKSLADYLGIPILEEGTTLLGGDVTVTALPFRAYALIWNEFYRDENLQEPCHIYLDETTRENGNVAYSTSPNNYYVTQTELGGTLCRACKFHDYFTSCLPEPQRGGAVELPLGDIAPIKSNNDVDASFIFSQPSTGAELKLFPGSGNGAGEYPATLWTAGSTPVPNSGDTLVLNAKNFVADLSQATAANINQLRMAFALQHVLEADAVGGTRYFEILHTHFGVYSPDARLQRPEYLGGKRIPLYINQVLQTSATGEGSTPQGNTAGFSFNADGSSAQFTKSFVEHGMIIGLAVIRAEHTYQQGLAKYWSKKRRFDFYMPEFAHIGSQPVYNKEIYLQGNEEDDRVFGYQEAWAEYRHKPSLVTGEMRSSYSQSLDVWHYADDYNSLPVLGSTWIQEPTTNIDRTLAVTSAVSDQFICDFSFDVYVTLPMPVHSVPGLKTL